MTNCSALRQLLKKCDITPKFARWFLFLEDFDLYQLRSHVNHVKALSRYSVVTVEDQVVIIIREPQDEDDRLFTIKQLLRVYG